MTSPLTSGEANVTNSLEMLLGKENSDITYLKKDQISDVLSKALSETYRNQPTDPVTFFAQQLLNHNKTLEYAYQVRLSQAHILADFNGRVPCEHHET